MHGEGGGDVSEMTVTDRAQLRQNIVNHFSDGDLELLCDDLGVDPEVVPGRERGKETWAGEIIRYFERRGRLAELLGALKQRRPNVAWDNTPGSQPEEQIAESAWWDQVPPQAGGDVIIATIGAGARGVAVGKNISQNLQAALGPATPSDPQLIGQALQHVNDALAGMVLDAAIKGIATFQLNLLKGELSKTESEPAPSASTITQVGDWLLQQTSALRPALADLFALPAAGRAVARAGDSAVAWVRQTFGQ